MSSRNIIITSRYENKNVLLVIRGPKDILYVEPHLQLLFISIQLILILFHHVLYVFYK